MDFIDQIKQFSKRVESLKDSIKTEEATKTSIIMPFFAMLGFDVFNPQEFVPEFTADVGIKKGEKVDYAILMEGTPVILVEAKSITEKLERHDSQLFRYFGTTKAKFAILTNGIVYKFYTDLEEPNKMDSDPFLEINILELRDFQIVELKKFHKSSFDINEIINVASELKYTNEFKNFLNKELVNPSDELVKLIIGGIYSGLKTQVVIERFRPIVKKAFNQFVNETMSDKLKTALDVDVSIKGDVSPEPIEVEESKIITTQYELEAFFLVKNILKEFVPMSDITFKDTESYIGVLYKNNTRKWICRFILTNTQKIFILPDENKKDIRYPISDIYDIEQYKDQLKTVLERYI